MTAAEKAVAAAEHAPVLFHARRENVESHAALITFEVSLDDVPECMKGARPGDHFLLVLVPMDREGVEPKIQPKTRGQRLNALAHTICEEPEFQRWAQGECARISGFNAAYDATPGQARSLILFRCGLRDRGELTRNEAACDRFEALLEAFEASRGRRYFRSAT
jgi:hypothetical protein